MRPLGTSLMIEDLRLDLGMVLRQQPVHSIKNRLVDKLTVDRNGASSPCAFTGS